MIEFIPNQLGYPLLSLLIFVPVIGAIVLLGVRDARAARWIALLFSVVELGLCVPLLGNFDSSMAHMQFGESMPWISASCSWGCPRFLRLFPSWFPGPR
jgi:NADH-quinone oxidoreductase subunit M